MVLSISVARLKITSRKSLVNFSWPHPANVKLLYLIEWSDDKEQDINTAVADIIATQSTRQTNDPAMNAEVQSVHPCNTVDIIVPVQSD